MKIDPQLLTGQTSDHVVLWGNAGMKVNREMVKALDKMADGAKKAGFDFQICSGFRDFKTQLNIWNAKAEGKRPLLDESGRPLDFQKLSPKEILYAILRWSALPGASRHHWGTDLDVYDAKACPKEYKIQLVPSEFLKGGIFSGLHEWLDQNMKSYGFFRPYEKDLGGVSPERWHISYAPLARTYLAAHSSDLLEEVLEQTEISLKEDLLAELPALYAKYVTNISSSS